MFIPLSISTEQFSKWIRPSYDGLKFKQRGGVLRWGTVQLLISRLTNRSPRRLVAWVNGWLGFPKKNPDVRQCWSSWIASWKCVVCSWNMLEPQKEDAMLCWLSYLICFESESNQCGDASWPPAAKPLTVVPPTQKRETYVWEDNFRQNKTGFNNQPGFNN